MLNRLAERYGMLVARATPPARSLAGLRKVFDGRIGELVGELRLSHRRGKHLRMARQAFESMPEGGHFREMALTFAVVALAAKVAQADGDVCEEEFAAFRKSFPLPLKDDTDIRQLYDSVLEDETDILVYARQVRQLFPTPQDRGMLKGIVMRLLEVARADGEVNDKEIALLRAVTDVFGVRSRAVERQLGGGEAKTPYEVLGVKRGWNDRRVREAYLSLIREAHPDRVQARGGSHRAVQAASESVARVNAAYAVICRERGIKGAS